MLIAIITDAHEHTKVRMKEKLEKHGESTIVADLILMVKYMFGWVPGLNRVLQRAHDFAVEQQQKRLAAARRRRGLENKSSLMSGGAAGGKNQALTPAAKKKLR